MPRMTPDRTAFAELHSPQAAAGTAVRRILVWLVAALAVMAMTLGAAAPASADERWQQVAGTVASLLEDVPALYSEGDLKAVEATIRKAYYEEYQASGLEDEIKHRLGADRAKAFQSGVVELRNLARDEAPRADVENKTALLVGQLATDVAELQDAPEVTDRWSRVAGDIVEAAENALALYEQGRADEGLKEATRAYLQHYEADGLEKATLSYLSNGRAAAVEAEFRDIRVGIRDGAPIEDVRTHVATLGQMVTEDAAALDALGAGESVGWGGFVAAFLILLREGVEALLVVAAVVTYVVKTGRRDQLRGVYLGIGAAIAVSIGLAWLFSSLTSSADLGMAQELIEGIAGALAAVMLIYISSWILSKSEGDAWHRYITNTVDSHAESGSQWALFTVVFLAVAREGFETILFFIPVFGAAQTAADHLLIWAGMGAAVLVLAALFIAVRRFGVRLPLRPFFRWTSVLLALLAITIAGGAAKELQDAMILEATPVAGVPQIDWLGLYPTVETLAAQGIVTAVVLGLMIWQFRKSAASRAAAPVNENTEERVESK
ncbi:MAG: FTR1 family iron permease [Propionibacteriaceae bacterium]|nr:FTR1 family iron permease [Propionibacteriaceae bacterium]